jgi:hypothetical protein
MRKNTFFYLVLSIFFYCSSGLAETPWGWFTLFPKQRLVPSFTANPTAHQFSAGEILKNRNVSTSMGGIFSLVDVHSGWFSAQLSVGSSVYAYLDPPSSVNLVTTDFYVDFVMIDIPLTERLTIRVAPGHTSHHLSDNAYEASGLEKSLNYVRDYWDVFTIYRSEELRGFLYGGAFYNYTYQIGREINKPWLFEFGAEFFQTPIATGIVAYCGFDIKLREESNYATTQNYQLGIKFLNDNSYDVRLALDFRTGIDERGQYVRNRERWVMVAAYIDI